VSSSGRREAKSVPWRGCTTDIPRFRRCTGRPTSFVVLLHDRSSSWMSESDGDFLQRDNSASTEPGFFLGGGLAFFTGSVEAPPFIQASPSPTPRWITFFGTSDAAHCSPRTITSWPICSAKAGTRARARGSRGTLYLASSSGVRTWTRW
jgi:hypothetical protein